jgi:uncharacterized protein (TIGR00661 family)
MNILYGVSGVGLGHSSRAILIGNYLKRKGHNIKMVTYSDGYEKLRNHFDCIKINGLEIVFKNNSIKKIRTLSYNIRNFPKNLLKLREFSSLLKNFKPDLCISDMEAVVPIISKICKIPLISIDNQHAITNLKFKVPLKYFKDYLFAKQVIKNFSRNPKKFIVFSFAKLKPKKKNTIVAPPVIRNEVRSLKPIYGKKILVYISKGEEEVLKTLKKINEKFVVYGFGNKIKRENMEFKTHETFLSDLEKCKFIIGTSGFSLLSEAVYLKKPYLAIPLKGHFEQKFNALVIKEFGFGEYYEKINLIRLKKFIKNLEWYKSNLKRNKFNQSEFFKILDQTLLYVKTTRQASFVCHNLR